MIAYRRRWSEAGVSREVLLALFEIVGIPVVGEAEVRISLHAIARADKFDLHYMVCGEDVCHHDFDPLTRDQDLELLLKLLNLDWMYLDNHDVYSWVLLHSKLGPIVSRGWNVRRAVVAGVFQYAAMRDRVSVKNTRVEEFKSRFVEEFALDPGC